MLRTLARITSACIALGTASIANAAIYNVTVTGPVNYSVIQGAMAPVPDGAPVSMSFNVDSNVFTNSPNFPTRGYNIDLSSFSMNVGGVNVPVVLPTPSGQPAYFVLRNNDPGVDGFFISDGNVDNPAPLAVTIPGLAPVHELDFRIGYSNATQISTLNIADAVGTYDDSAIGSYYWAIGRFGNAGAEYDYQKITIAPIPEPTMLGVVALCAVPALRRRRRRCVASM